MKELELLLELEVDINMSSTLCIGLAIHSTEYAYWNGVRCQAEKIKKAILK